MLGRALLIEGAQLPVIGNEVKIRKGSDPLSLWANPWQARHFVLHLIIIVL